MMATDGSADRSTYRGPRGRTVARADRAARAGRRPPAGPPGRGAPQTGDHPRWANPAMDHDHRPPLVRWVPIGWRPAALHGCMHRGPPRTRTDGVDRGLRAGARWRRHALRPHALPAVPEPTVRERLPGGRHLPNARGAGPDRPGPLHRLPDLHGCMPVRPALLQLGRAAESAGGPGRPP